MLAELLAMGFGPEDATVAYNKAKKKDLDSILDIIAEE